MKKTATKNLVWMILAGSLLFACSTDEPAPEEVLIRIQNTSVFDFNNVFVNTGGGENNFGTLAPGEYSVYQTFESAYRYAFIELQIDEATYTIQPIDYVGETPLSVGKYTYQLNATNSDEQYGRLSLTLQED